jgi:CobQ/CobB/MinD/ParA nucleotide binding domain
MFGKAGRIVTFYSYKGGTGRTMAVSNVAWILASNGYDVLLIDWDLEAPGLHRYLRPFLVDPELANTPGLIEFMWDAAQASMTPAEPSGSSPSQPVAFPSLEDYVVGLDWDFRGKGSIHFIPAGRQDENYAQRVNTFNWDNFYERLGGGKLLHAERERLREKYDYILIDSRTGVSDTSSICTVQMPDILAVFFTLNRQSIKGAAAVAASVTAAVQASRNETLRIFPVPTRIEEAEAEKLELAIKYARRLFARFLMHVQPTQGEPDLDAQAIYWKEVETRYVPFYAYEEVPAAFRDESGSRRGLLAPNERIAYWISDQKVSAMRSQIASESERERVVKAFAFTADEGRGFEIKAPTETQSVWRDLIDRIWWQLSRYPWQYAAVAATISLVGVGLDSIIVRTQLTSQLQVSNQREKLINFIVQGTLTDLKILEAKLPQPPSTSSDVFKTLNDARDKLTSAQSLSPQSP